MPGEIERTGWERFDHDPRLPAHQHLRAADRDRDVVSELLTQAFAEGRLDRDELDERQDRLVRTRTLGDLPPLVQDLVSDRVDPHTRSRALREEAEEHYRKRLLGALGGFLGPTLICWAIWISLVLSGNGTEFPWPIFVTIGTAMGPIGVLSNGREKQVREIQRELEEKAQRREERRRRRLQGGA